MRTLALRCQTNSLAAHIVGFYVTSGCNRVHQVIKLPLPNLSVKALGLLSGGIDSPVALYLMKERGCEVIPVYFDLQQFGGEDTKQRAIDCAKKLGFKEIYILPHGENLHQFTEKCETRFTCVFCKRMMMRIAGKLAEKLGAEALITGDSLGQVASQTPLNLLVETTASGLPILRPLIGFNKEETVQIARKIGTFQTSTSKAACCSATPEKPATRARPEQMESEEKKLDVEVLIKSSLAGAKRLIL